MRRALLLINPGSRTGDVSPERIASALTEADIVVSRTLAGPADDLARAARAGRADHGLVVVGGGDGTLGAVARELLDGGPVMGVLPLGTANDFARTLEIPADPLRAVEVIATAAPRAVDVGMVNGIPFLNAASVGLSADLAAELSDDTKRRFGRGGYLLTALRVILRSRSFYVRIEGEFGTAAARSLMLAVGNGRHHGGGLTVAPDATIDDGKLDLYSLETTRLWRLALIAWALRSGSHVHWSDVRANRGDWFEIATRRPRPVNVDGELRTETPARFTIRKGALRVLAPPPSTTRIAGTQ